MVTETRNAEPEIRTELMRKERFDDIKQKFNAVSKNAEESIKTANPKDILAITLSFDNPVDVIEAKVITPDEYFREAFSK